MTRHRAARGVLSAALGAAVAVTAMGPGGCGGQRSVQPFLAPPYPERLADWRLFESSDARLAGNAGVLPYDLNTPLFSDYAEKHRTVWMPAGRAAQFRVRGVLDFPVGTILTKTFYYRRVASAGSVPVVSSGPAGPDERLLVETRLLVHGEGGWVALPYVWNDAQTEARLEVAGAERRFIRRSAAGDEAFDYVVPNTDQCAGCHVTQSLFERRLRPLGPTAPNLARTYAYADGGAPQLERWTQVGYLEGAPPAGTITPLPVWDDPRSGDAAARARAYLEVQCAHCHGEGGPALSSGLSLAYDDADPLRLGVCKTPVAAGRGSGRLRYDVVPGQPDESILLFRMLSREPDVMMPELGRSLRHDEGTALVRQWIAALPGACE